MPIHWLTVRWCSTAAKVKTAFEQYRVGSVLNTPLGHAQTPETRHRIISGIRDASMEYIGVPDIFGVDQNHGTTYTQGGTLFPQEINMAASFNRDLVREARITAYESRACAIPWVYNPVITLAEILCGAAYGRVSAKTLISTTPWPWQWLRVSGDDPNHVAAKRGCLSEALHGLRQPCHRQRPHPVVD